MVGGDYLCFEGFEKIADQFLSHKAEDVIYLEKMVEELIVSNAALLALEKENIKGTIRTDFVVSVIAVIMTIGVSGLVSGLVSGIVKLDDGGLLLIKATPKNVWCDFKCWFDHSTLWFAPVLMKTLSVVATNAMFIVGARMVLHGIRYPHHLLHIMWMSWY